MIKQTIIVGSILAFSVYAEGVIDNKKNMVKEITNSGLVAKPVKADSYRFFIKEGVADDKGGIKKHIGDRVLARWKLVEDGNYYSAYDYLSPTQKQVIAKKRYSNTFGGALNYTGVKVTKIECDNEDMAKAELCDVKVFVSYTSANNKAPFGTLLTEKWTKEDGEWWYYQK